MSGNMKRKYPRTPPYDEIHGKYRMSYGPITPLEEAEVEEE